MDDVVIIGSGVAGALIACRLARAGLNTVLIEAGGDNQRLASVERYRNSWRRDPGAAYARDRHALYPDRNTPDKYLQIKGNDPYWANYIRLTGGSTWHWTGITPRFVPNDFRLRTRYGVGRDWPVDYDEIEPWYLDAEQELGVSGNGEHGSPRSGPYPMPALAMPYSDRVIADRLKPHELNVHVLPAARNSIAYADRPACCGNNTCTPICPIGAQYSADVHVRQAVRYGARLITNAVASFIHVDNEGKIESIEYKKPDGSIEKISGRYYVLACNGIETPKLLLMSRANRYPRGVGNSSGLVGRGLMDHPTTAVDFLMPVPVYTGRGPQVVSTIDSGRDGESRSRHAAGKFFILNTHDIQKYVTDLIDQDRDWRDLNERIIHYSSHYAFIGVEMEQLPERHNRIVPSDKKFDDLGIPKPEIHMQFNEYLYRAEVEFQKQLGLITGYLGAEKLRSYKIGELWPNHPMGTTCMGNSPEQSVVNADCQSHDHENLFVAGSAVFPTGGTANPTLTIAALSLRLADRLLAASGR